MNLTALKSWVSGETLTAADLNAEFQNIYTHTINNSDIDSTASYVLGELVIGTGLAAADGGQLHVHTGSAGTVQAASDADEAVFENSTASGITILSGASSTGKIAFGDAGDNDIGLITYNHATNALTLGTNGATALTLSSAQAATFAGDVSVSGALTLTGGLTLNGAVVVGDSASDTLTVNATVTSDLLFTDATYDIGKSGATRPRDGFFSRNMAVGGTLGVTGATTLSSTLGVTGALTATAGITSGSDIVSDSDSTDDLGTTSVRWANLYVDSIGDTGQALAITAGSNNVNVTAGTLALTGAQTISSTLGVTGLITASGGLSGTTGTFSGDVAVNSLATFKPSASNANLIVKVGSINSDSIRLEAGGTTSTYLESRGYLGHSWYVNTTRKATLDANGLGIGVDSPQGAVHARTGTDKNIRLQTLGSNAGIGVLNDASSSYVPLNLEANDLIVNQYSGGNMGLGVTPSAWSVGKAFEVGGAGNALWYSGTTGDVLLRSNVYYDSGDKYGANGYATQLKLNNNGAFEFYTAPSGTANAAATFTNRMTLTHAGNLGLNTAAPASNAAIHAVTTGYSSSGAIILEDTRTDANPFIQIKNDARQYNLQVAGARSDNFEVYDNTAGAIRLALTSGGNVGIGVTPSAWRSTETALQIANRAALYADSNLTTALANNLIINSSGFALIEADKASQYYQYQGAHYWQTVASGSAGQTVSPSTLMTLTSSGRLFINHGSRNSLTQLNVKSDGGGGGLKIYQGDTSPTNGSELGSIAFSGVDSSNNNNSSEAKIFAVATEAHGGSNAGTSMAFMTKPNGTGPGSAPTERIRLLSSGGLTFNGDTATANALSDYEEGTHIPSVGCSTSGSMGLNSSRNTLQYTKIGNWVNVQGYVEINSVSSGVGYVTLSMPFANQNDSEYSGITIGSLIVNVTNNPLNCDRYTLYMQQGSSEVRIYATDGGVLQSDSAENITTAGGADLYLNISYRTQ